jgi:hypothetical protein
MFEKTKGLFLAASLYAIDLTGIIVRTALLL